MIDGRVVLREAELATINEDEAIEEANRQAILLLERTKIPK